MSSEYRYQLEKGSKKYLCPNCNKKRFVRYVDTKTGELLPPEFGRCDRESKCSYHCNPYKEGYSKQVCEQEKGNFKKKPPLKKREKLKLSFIPVEVLQQTQKAYEQNVFIQNLLNRIKHPFKVEDVEKVVSLYHLGTIKKGFRSGAVTFPFIDIQNRIRAIQVKEFDQENHTKSTDFLHSMIEQSYKKSRRSIPSWLRAYQENEKKVSCLFGEHLLQKYPHNPVALVEAPKTAIYGALYFGFPDNAKNLLWLAVYNLSSLNLNKCQALKGRNVFLFPDLSKEGKAYDLWSTKADQIQMKLEGAHFQTSNLLEQLAPNVDKEQGKDLADYLTELDWKILRSVKSVKSEA